MIRSIFGKSAFKSVLGLSLGLGVITGAIACKESPKKVEADKALPISKAPMGPPPGNTGDTGTGKAPTPAALAAALKVVPLVSSEMMEFTKKNVVVLVYADPKSPMKPEDIQKFQALKNNKVIPESGKLEILAGNESSMETYFGKSIGWPVVIVRGPKGQRVFSGPQAATMVTDGIKQVAQ